MVSAWRDNGSLLDDGVFVSLPLQLFKVDKAFPPFAASHGLAIIVLSVCSASLFVSLSMSILAAWLAAQHITDRVAQPGAGQLPSAILFCLECRALRANSLPIVLPVGDAKVHASKTNCLFRAFVSTIWLGVASEPIILALQQDASRAQIALLFAERHLSFYWRPG